MAGISLQIRGCDNLKIISQTNRTLLLEEFNPEKLDLLTMIGDVKGIDSLSDDKIKEINDVLLCRSYEEFQEKFAPCIYSFFDANTQTVRYTLKKPENIPENMLTEIPLNQQNDFLKMLFSLMESKKSQGVLNVDFGFERLLDMISPRKVMEDIRQVRKEIRYNYGKYAALEEGDPARLDVGDKLNMLFEQASDNYNNVLAMLPLAIEDIKTRLLLGAGGQGANPSQIALGMLTMGEKGELKVLEAPRQETTALAAIDDHINTGLAAALEEDYRQVNECPTDYVKDLVVRTFCPLPSTIQREVDVEQEAANYNSYLQFYKQAKDGFIKVVKPLVEKMLGVKMFFDQYKCRVKGMAPTLLVANIRPEMLAKSTSLPTLHAYLNSTNGKNNFADTVWYAIFPNLSIDPRQGARLRRERFAGNVHKQNENVNSMETLATLLDVLKDYKVETFFSFEGRDDTTFDSMAAEGVQKYIDRCEPLVGRPYSEYAIPCLPNFTVIPKNKSGVTLDRLMTVDEDNTARLSEAKEDIMRLWIEGVYIGAAYIAAGFRAACQCPDYLHDHYKRRRADSELPGVRYDVESGDHALWTRTTMPKEITGFTNSIKDQINRRNFGWVFASENAAVDGRNITEVTIYKARNLLYDPERAAYEPAYKTQVTTYIERVLRHATGDFKEDRIKMFFSNNPSSQKSQWVARQDCVNAVLDGGDDLDYAIDESTGLCDLTIYFDGNARNLEVEINRLSSKK